MADEIHDLRAELDELRAAAARAAAANPEANADPRTGARRLGELATRAEEIAATLEHP